MQVAEGGVLDQRDRARRQQGDQRGARRVVQARAGGIADRRRQQAGADAPFAGEPLDLGQRLAGAAVEADRQGLHAEPSQRREEAVIGRRFDDHHIAGPRHRLQAQAEGLDAAVGDQHLVGAEVAIPVRRVRGQAGAQALGAGRERHRGEQPAVTPRRGGDAARQRLDREQRLAAQGGAERHHAGAAFHVAERDGVERVVLESVIAEPRGIDAGPGCCALAGRLARARRDLPRFARRAADEITLLRPALDQAPILERPIGGQHRGDADRAAARQLAHRGQALPGAPEAGPDLAGQMLGERAVQDLRGSAGGIVGARLGVMSHVSRRARAAR